MKKFIAVLIVFLTVNNLYGQNEHSQITIMAGGSVSFPFNSYTKMESGMEFANWTRLKILYFEEDGSGAPAGGNWHLLVRSTTGNIQGDGGGSMNLDKVELLVALNNPAGGETITTPYTITNIDTEIVSGGANPTGHTTSDGTVGLNTEVWISYRVGNLNGTAPPAAANSILGEAPGYYYVDLVFTLEKQ